MYTCLCACTFIQVQYFSTFGGIGISDTVRKITRHMLCNEILSKYSMKGFKGKLKFGALLPAKVIIGMKLEAINCCNVH